VLFDPVTAMWEVLPDMNEQRWYPTVIRLRRAAHQCGGGQRLTRRAPACEIRSVDAGLTVTGLRPADRVPPSALPSPATSFSRTPPQLYDVASGQWRLTGNFEFQARG
jgi:hypothetical protein